MAILSRRIRTAEPRRGSAVAARWIGTAVALVLAAALASRAGDPEPQAGSRDLPEYVIKAGFLFNFAKYVDWPDTAFDGPHAPIQIGVVGKDPFGEELDRILKDKTVKERSFRIARFTDPASIRRCHILFVPRSETARTEVILGRVELWPVLTVGEDGAFSRAGGTVSILVENDRPRLEINADAAGRAGLTISTKLLKAATIVKGERR